MYKKLIGLFMLVILLVQVLPIKQLGIALTNNYFTEELNNNPEEAGKKITNETEDFTAILKHSMSFIQAYTSTIYSSNPLNTHHSVTIPSKREICVFAPPPNIIVVV